MSWIFSGGLTLFFNLISFFIVLVIFLLTRFFLDIKPIRIIRDIIIKLSISWIVSFFVLYFPVMGYARICKGPLCGMWGLIIAIIAFPIAILIFYLILSSLFKVESRKRIIINLITAIAIISLLLTSFHLIKVYVYPFDKDAAIKKDNIGACQGNITDKIYYPYLSLYDDSAYQAMIADCVYNYAMHKKDITVCENIEKPDYKRGTCIMEVINLISPSDASICDKLKKENDRCLRVVAESLGDSEICKKIDDNNHGDKKRCYEDVAYATKDISLCDSYSCYERILNILEPNEIDISLCEKITKLDQDDGWSFKDQCYYHIALRISDITGCDNIIGLDTKGGCYYHIANNTENINLCERIDDNQRKYKCYTNVSRYSEDPNICNKLDNELWLSACLSARQK